MSKSDKTEYIDNPDKDYKLVITSKSEDADNDETFLVTAENIQKQSESWMFQALQSFDKGGSQYSVRFNEDSTSLNSDTTLDTIKELALNAQSDIGKIQKINVLVRQAENEDDIIGKVHETIEANLNANIRFSFNNLPDDYDEELKKKTEGIIKRFHKEVNINDVMTTAITSTYDEGNCIQYLRSKKSKGIYHHVIDKYPLGVAIISDYSLNSIPYVLIDTTELTNRLQKSTLKNKKNKPLFFKNTTEEIKNNYPKEVIDAYVSREKYAVLDIRRTGVNRFGNLGRAYGVSPVFRRNSMALFPAESERSTAALRRENAEPLKNVLKLYQNLQLSLVWQIIWEENTFAQRDARIFRAASYGRPGCSRPQNGEYR